MKPLPDWGLPLLVEEQRVAKRRINGEETVWFAEKEKRFHAQSFDLGGRRRNLRAKSSKEIAKKLRDATN
jgi:hypothetical protein